MVDDGIHYRIVRNDPDVRVSAPAPRLRRVRSASVAVLFAALLVLAALSPLSSAQAATDDFVFTGRGWGHGMGMSQWGAWQAAREGVEFDEILAFYYPGTALETMADPNAEVKVRISSKPWTSNTDDFVQVDLKPSVVPMTLVKYSGGSTTSEEIPLGSFINVFCAGSKVQVVTAAGSQGPYDYVDVRPVTGGAEGRIAIQLKTSYETVDYREYWGTIRVQPSDVSGKLWVYNFVLLEKYVRSIAEVDYDWAMSNAGAYAPEAVKAQAVAARTYAAAKVGTLADNQYDQCYRGYSFEASYPGIAQAAEETAGLILTYQGQPINAYFSAHSGGYTTDSAWSGAKPAYIVAQPDPWSLAAPPSTMHSAGPGYNWTYTISAAALSAEVDGSLKSTSGSWVDVGTISRVEIVERDTNDYDSHAKTLRLTGSKGSALVSAASFRGLFGYSSMRSTLILSVTGGEPLALGEFYDVGSNHLYHDEIARMVTAGLMNGYANGLFKPEGSVTRWQFAKVAVNLHNLMYPEDEIVLENVTRPPFADVPVDSGTLGDMSDWVAAAKEAGLVTGVTSTAFAPYTEVRRDQMATMMCRALGWMDEAAALPAGTSGFADVPKGSTHWAPAAYLLEQSIILGYADGTLRPEEPIKRKHVAVILCRVLDLQ